MNPLLRAAIAGLTLVTSTALPSTASAQRSGGARPAIQNFPNQSAGGSLFLTKPGPVVLGQPIDVALQVPLLPAELKDKPVFFRWYVAKTAPDARMPGRVAIGGDTDVSPRPAQTPTAANAPRRLTFYAPFERPDVYELRMLVSTAEYGYARLLGRLTVDVQVGRARSETEDSRNGAIYLGMDKDVFHVGEAVDITVKLPEDRYYQGNLTGPNVVFYPKEFADAMGRDGKPLQVAKTEAVKWLSSTWGCNNTCAPLGDQIRIPNQPAPIGYGLATKSGKYTVRAKAPIRPGVYEVRLYDRGFSAFGYEDYYLEKIKVVVEPVATTPETLSFVTLRPPIAPLNPQPVAAQPGRSPAPSVAPKPRQGNRLEDYEAVEALVHGGSYRALAAFKPVPDVEPPPSVTVKTEWLVWSSETNQWVLRDLAIVAKLIGPWLYVSDEVPVNDVRK